MIPVPLRHLYDLHKHGHHRWYGQNHPAEIQ